MLSSCCSLHLKDWAKIIEQQAKMDHAQAQQQPGTAPQILTNAADATPMPPASKQVSDETSIISSFSLCINQTLFAGNLDCLTATSIHDHPRRYLAVLVAQSDTIVGLFLYDPMLEMRVDRLSLKLDEAIDAIAIDSSTDDFVVFSQDDNSFSLKSVSDSGLLHTYKFVCANSLAFSSWRFHLLGRDQKSSSAVTGSGPGSMAVPSQMLSARQELQEVTEQLSRSSEIARTTMQKLSSMEVAYKCISPFPLSSPSHSVFADFAPP
jgi:hypothetical protein